MKSFLNRQRVKVTAEGHPYHGKTGTVWRLLKRDESAWVNMDEDLLQEDRHFPPGDERFRNLNLFPQECEEVRP